MYKISIHAPIVGCDVKYIIPVFDAHTISIHAPIVGCDNRTNGPSESSARFQSTHPSWGATMPTTVKDSSSSQFQSTHPSWGATIWEIQQICRLIYFNPRTHRGVRLLSTSILLCFIWISIHAPIVGCDLPPFGWLTPTSLISIHAPIVGCDFDDS